MQICRRYVKPSGGHGALDRAYKAFCDECKSADKGKLILRINRRDEQWDLNRVSDFLQVYADEPCRAILRHDATDGLFSFQDEWGTCELTVRLDSLAGVQRIVGLLGLDVKIAGPAPIFVGHGRDPQWHILVNHLRELHHFQVITYETIAKLGQPASEVLDMAARSVSMALLVHTAEVQTVGGEWQAMPNVVHETGFFGAHLGRERALVLREDACRPFTNIAGLTELRFSDHNIREVFGDVVAVLHRNTQYAGLPSYGEH